MILETILSALFLQGGAAVMANPIIHPSGYDYQRVVNPYGVAEAGFEAHAGRWSFELYGRHISSLGTAKDSGADTVEFAVKFHPFAHQP